MKRKSPLTPLFQRGGLATVEGASKSTSPPLVKEGESASPASVNSTSPHFVKEGESTSSAPVTSNTPPFVKGGLGGISDEEQPFELPQGWEWTLLGEITNFGTTEKLDSISDDTWVLDLEDIEKDTSKLLQKFKFSERRSLSTKNSFLAGDVLYGKLRPYLNKVIVADEDGVCTTEILPFRCYGPFSNNYFKFTLKSPYFISYVNARSYGIKMPRLGTEDGKKAFFPLPPLAEQHRIVAKVDELMALCDQLETQHTNAAEAHEKLVNHLLGTLTQSPKTGSPLCKRGAGGDFDWQRIAAHFDTLFTTEASIDALKQTLLQLAVMGKLVPQDPNDEPASELLNRIQAEKANLFAEGKIKKAKPLSPITEEEKPFELPLGWEWTRLDGLTSLITKGSSPKWQGVSYTDSPEDIMFVTSENVGSYTLLLDSPKYVEKKFNDIEPRSILENGDFLMNIVGASIGRTAVYDMDSLANINQAVCLIRITNFNLSRLFLLHFFNSETCLEYMFDKQVDNARPNLSMGNIAKFLIPIPPLAEQQRIVAKVDELMAICDQLKSRITEASQLQKKLADVLVEQATA